jgi:hypothetical protein
MPWDPYKDEQITRRERDLLTCLAIFLCSFALGAIIGVYV